MKESIVSALEFTDPLFSQVKTIEIVIGQQKILFWGALNFPDICSWPTVGEANGRVFPSANEKDTLLHTHNKATRKIRKRGLAAL
jgi:hypothetical protein